MEPVEKKLVRVQKDRLITGVCAGFARYLNVDISIVRIILVAFTLLGGAGVLAYIIASFIIPKEAGWDDSIPMPSMGKTLILVGVAIVVLPIILYIFAAILFAAFN